MIEKDLLTTGNAVKDGKRGWFVGQFVPPSFGLTHQHALEMKWGRHAKGEERRRFAKSRSATRETGGLEGVGQLREQIPHHPGHGGVVLGREHARLAVEAFGDGYGDVAYGWHGFAFPGRGVSAPPPIASVRQGGEIIRKRKLLWGLGLGVGAVDGSGDRGQ